MSVFEHPEFHAHEQIVHCHDRDSGLKAIIAVHDTTCGPALGGVRIWPYPSEDEALRDVLRLSRGMTYKSALAGLALGGGKAVVIGDPHHDKTPALMTALGRAVECLGGRYIAAEDSGTTVSDLRIMRTATRHVVGIAQVPGWDGKMRNGDPSPATAYGCFVGIRAAVRHRFGQDSLEGIRVAIQGVGNVGRHLAELLDDAGAELVVSDVQCDQVRLAAERFGARVVSPEAILDCEADVFAPCAMGAVIDDRSLERLNVAIVAGSANNQLAEDRHADGLAERGILYAPDFAINAGGIIDVASEAEGYDPVRVRARLEAIADTLGGIFDRARERGVSPHRVAGELAEQRLAAARAARTGVPVLARAAA